MNNHKAALVAWSIWGVCLVLWALSFWIRTLGGISGDVERVLSTLAFVALATAAALVASRRPESPFGWIVGAYALLAACEGVAIGYAIATASSSVPRLLGDGTAAAWLGAWIGPAASPLLILALLLVPGGRLPSPRWRTVAWFVIASGLLGAACGAFSAGPLVNRQPNPLGIAGTEDVLPQLRSLSRTLLLIGFAAAVASLAARFRTAVGEERQQLKWVATGALVWVVATLVIRINPNPSFLTPYLGTIYLVGLLAFGAAVSVAILRYRLYEIDLVISRALVYGGLAACITIVYIGIVAGIGALAHTGGEGNLLLSLVATGLVATIFQPARERLQRMANRLVYGQRASPYEVLADFSGQIAGALSVDEVLPRIAEAAAHGVRASRSRVRVYVPRGGDRAVAWPYDAVGGPFERSVPILHQGTPVGEIAIGKDAREPITSAEDRLLADLAAQAGPALRNVQLDIELQARLEELHASRQRIVTAQDAERRRLERDIHDGAQQDLVALAVNARLARELVRPDPDEAETLLEDIGSQATHALTRLRELARGVFPAVLTERGLVAAIESRVVGSPGARLETDHVGLDARFAPEVEAAAYFCCLEALQNCAKHASGASVTVSLVCRGGEWLEFAVSDDGPGFDPRLVASGSGRQNMADRLAAVGGTLHIRSAPGQGTTVTGTLPARTTTAPTRTAKA